MSQLLDGRSIADQILADTGEKVGELIKQYIRPMLAIILIGRDPASVLYTTIKKNKAESLGIKVKIHKLAARVNENTVLRLIETLNKDKKVTGILVQMPIPKRISRDKVVWAIATEKDVDGFQMRTFLPPAPVAILELLHHYNINPSRKKMLIIGNGFLVGKPLATLATKQGARVTVADSTTPNLVRLIQDNQIIVAATGNPHIVTAQMVKPEHIIIDAGGGQQNGQFVGDVNFEKIKDLVSGITPNPGGVGPLTVAILAQNIVKAAKLTKVNFH